MLAVDASPEVGESLPGLLARTARHMGMATRELVGYLRLQVEGTRPHNLYLPVDPSVRTRVREILEIDDDQLDDLTIARFGAFHAAPTGAPSNGAALKLQREYWWPFGGDRFCPQCLRTGSPWLVEWQHSWSFACTEHRIELRDTCSSCGQPAALLGGQATDERCACGAAWSSSSATPASEDAVATQDRVNTVVGSRRARSWGTWTSGLDVLGAWRATGTLLAGHEPIPRWTARPWLTPPDPSVTSMVMTSVRPIATARSTRGAAEELRTLFDGADDVITNLIRDRLPDPCPLTPVIEAWQTTRARVATRLDHTHHQQALDLVDLGSRALPTLAPLGLLNHEWLRPGAPDPLLRRCAVSLAAARLGGAATWEDAGARVGVNGRYAPRVVRYVIPKMGDAAAAQLTEAAGRLVHCALEHDFALSVAHPPIDSFVAMRSFAQANA